MKLSHSVFVRLALVLAPVLAIWGALFYRAAVSELYDEVDDALDRLGERLIRTALAENDFSATADGSTASYRIDTLAGVPAAGFESRYFDTLVWQPGVAEYEPSRALRRVFQGGNRRYYELCAMTPTFEADDLADSLWWGMLVLYGALFLSVLIVVSLVFRGSLKPFYRSLHWLERFRVERDPEPLSGDTAVAEFRRLDAVVREMAGRNRQAYDQQKRFIENASHELQTPLAVCQNRLELLASDPELGAGPLRQVVEAQESLRRLARLNKSLLLLSRIENGQFEAETEVDFNRLVKHYVNDFRQIYRHKHIALELSETGDFRLFLNETLAEVLVSNLLKNACVHNRAGGTLRVDISAAELRICNSADGEPLPPDRMFERFYRGRGGDFDSSGLGLSIAQAICSRFGIGIAYVCAGGMHCFTLTAPKK